MFAIKCCKLNLNWFFSYFPASHVWWHRRVPSAAIGFVKARPVGSQCLDHQSGSQMRGVICLLSRPTKRENKIIAIPAKKIDKVQVITNFVGFYWFHCLMLDYHIQEISPCNVQLIVEDTFFGFLEKKCFTIKNQFPGESNLLLIC